MLPMNKAKWKCPNCKISKKISQSSPQELIASQPHSILNVDANSLMSHFDERFNRLNSTIESFKTFITDELKKVTDTVKKWTERIVNIESSVKSVNERIDNFEQWVRFSNIQINGIPQKKGENLINIVKLLAERSNFKLCPDTDIDFVTRVATKNDLDIKKPKPIIVKMQARYKKDDFLSSLRKLGSIKASDIGFPGVQNQIYVNDHLSTCNKALLREPKRLSKEKGYVYCWVRNCTIMVRRTDNSPVLHITSEESLKKIS
ncbi:zinc finger DNA binding protein [Danaus plexippus plexippus]|uniref:Zinc finger DNA binding protein n=1 Tax=Danaus plexippus plexippus TaxID=278856 RepID=A0A212F6C5_DANPL|nr:zinc finger DNA binding protein [Danaus plexippus plexippus]